MHHGGTPLANTAMVYAADSNAYSRTNSLTTEQHPQPARSKKDRQGSESTVDSLSLLRDSLKGQRVPAGAAELILRAWSKGTLKSYGSVFQKWTAFCSQRKVDPLQGSLTNVLDFLTELFQSGAGFSTLNTTRSALSAIMPSVDGRPVGEHHLISKLLKGAKSVRPARPRYSVTWNPNIVTSYLKSCDNVTLKEITHNLVMLIALVTGQRAQTLHALKINDMTIEEELISFTLSSSLKIRGPGEVIELVPFTDEKLCIVTLLHKYLFKTKDIRQGCDELFISINRPHGPVTVDTIRRWVLKVLKASGVNTSLFKAHSTRSASASAAFRKKVSLKSILKAGLWRSANVFTKFYNRDIQEVDDSFARGVLS